MSLLSTLGLTILIEYPIAQIIWLLLKKFGKDDGKGNSKLTFFNGLLIIVPVIIINALTNPAINLYARALWSDVDMSEETFWFIISLWEVVIFLVEGLLYKFMLKTSLLRGMLLSICSNGISYLSSFLIK
jgi:hypothetical protein